MGGKKFIVRRTKRESDVNEDEEKKTSSPNKKAENRLRKSELSTFIVTCRCFSHLRIKLIFLAYEIQN